MIKSVKEAGEFMEALSTDLMDLVNRSTEAGLFPLAAILSGVGVLVNHSPESVANLQDNIILQVEMLDLKEK